MKRLGFLDGRRIRVGGVPSWGAVPGLLIPGTMEAFGIFEDFLKSTELAAGETPTGFETDVFNGGGAFIIAEHIGGCGLWQPSTTANDGIQSTLGSIDGGSFLPQADKDIWFEARIKADPPDDIILAVGLQDPNAAVYMGNGNAGPAVDNHLLFNIVDENDGEAQNWYFEGDKAGTADPNDLSVALASLTFVTLGFHVHGHDAATGLLARQVDVYVNRALVAAGKVLTDHIPTTGLMPCVCIVAGQSETQAIYVDYIMCIQQR